MPVRYHESLGVSRSALERMGAFNGFVDLDSEFYVDPRLLARTRVPELKSSDARFRKHFKKVLTLLNASETRDDMFWQEAAKKLRFKEVRHTGLGYGKTSTHGSGVGPKLATYLTETASQLLRAGIRDPDVFDLVGLFQDGFGADRVSDITVRIILPDILAYTARVARKAGARTKKQRIEGIKAPASVPYDRASGEWFLLLPQGILTDLPVAHVYDDISYVCAHSEELREYVNKTIGDDWRATLADMSKRDVRKLLLRDPELLQKILGEYRSATPEAYDFANDPKMELGWDDVAKQVVRDNPLSLELPSEPQRHDVLAVVVAICDQFQHLVEHKGVWEVLWNEEEKPRIERVAQRLFLSVAESYCKANNLGITPEANSGAGPVDFKVNRGYSGTVVVELKRSGNTQLEHGYTKQLEVYKTTEKADGFFVIIDFGDRNDDLIRRLANRSRRAEREQKKFSRVYVVDATPKESASRRS